MGTKIGIWIDHRKAVIMFLREDGEEVKLIISNVERQLRRTGGSPLKGAFEHIRLASDISQKRNYQVHLDTYYDSVIACIGDAEKIRIMGPGEAKNELKSRLDSRKLGDRIVGVDTAGLMTHNQLAARIRKSF